MKIDTIAFFDGREEKEIVCDQQFVADIKSERLDKKKNKPRILRKDKLEFDSQGELLEMQNGFPQGQLRNLDLLLNSFTKSEAH